MARIDDQMNKLAALRRKLLQDKEAKEKTHFVSTQHMLLHNL